MKKLLLVLLLVGLIVTPVFADRNVSTIAGYSSSTLVKRGDWKVYRITFMATTAGGNFALYDSLSQGQTDSNIKTEGSEAVSLNSKVYDFTNKPLEGSTGLYIAITTGKVIVSYE